MIKPKEIKKEGLFFAIIRIVLGVVFIFSSFVKGIDPLGTAYRVEDYLDAYGWYSLYHFALAISILLITVEFLLGFALVFKIRAKMAAIGALLLMVFFTIVTYFDALYNMVPDCGCFGDAIKLSNWATFYKNIVFSLFAIITLAGSNRMARKLPLWLQNIMLLLVAGLYVFFILYNYNHLPMIDFRDWKEGKDMKASNLDSIKTYVTYKNKQTGEIKEFESPNYPWNDSVWMSRWEFVDQRIDRSAVKMNHYLIIMDESGSDYTDEIINNPGYQFMLISNDLDHADEEGMAKAARLYKDIEKQGGNFVLITSSFPETIKKYKDVFGIDYPYYFADDIELKAMIRSNPGLILLHNGVVMEKWHYNDFPETMKEAEEEAKE
ncbi:MAG: DoxX family protein [Chlorobi bacterium]|nr:DoxX family protein [Chlorobiota bacterium]